MADWLWNGGELSTLLLFCALYDDPLKIGGGYDGGEIGEILFISEKTVRNHRYNIIKKLQIPRDNYSLLKWALTYLKSN